MVKKRNPIVEAAERDEDNLPLASDESEFELPEMDTLSDDDALDDIENMGVEERQRLERSRRRGMAPAHGREPAHSSPERENAAARNPKRERAIEWRPANTLDAPPPRPGMEQRWIRFQLGANADPQNISRKLRDGWAPRKLETVTEDFNPPTIEHGSLGSVISVGDLLLCERDRNIGAARRRYFRDKQARQVAASKRQIKSVERGDYPIEAYAPFEKPTVGRGRRVKAQDDSDGVA